MRGLARAQGGAAGASGTGMAWLDLPNYLLAASHGSMNVSAALPLSLLQSQELSVVLLARLVGGAAG